MAFPLLFRISRISSPLLSIGSHQPDERQLSVCISNGNTTTPILFIGLLWLLCLVHQCQAWQGLHAADD